eukprot:COSAG04_NODE_1912_length_5248_cov_4.464945_2_plen_71_part_00
MLAANGRGQVRLPAGATVARPAGVPGNNNANMARLLVRPSTSLAPLRVPQVALFLPCNRGLVQQREAEFG